MQKIAKWNAKHFLVDMFKEILEPRVKTAYLKQLQLMHINCNWKFDKMDLLHLTSSHGFETMEQLEYESWEYIMTSTNSSGFINKHHQDCQTVHRSQNTYLLEPSLVDSYQQEAEKIINRQVELGVELVNNQLKT